MKQKWKDTNVNFKIKWENFREKNQKQNEENILINDKD